MSDTRSWLAERLADAPDTLRDRMLDAVANASGSGATHDVLANAAALCLERAMSEQARRASALNLLAADALMTHACEAAAEAGSDVLATFTAAWNAERFERLLPTAAP